MNQEEADAIAQVLQKIAEIVEWVWPTNTRQGFDVYQLGDVMVEIPTKKGS